MTTASPVAQFPWPLVIGAVVGLVLAGIIGFRGCRHKGTPGRVAFVATALTGASAGAFLGVVWLWTVPMDRSVACLYSCTQLQFLSTEQFRQILVMTDLAWILPLASVFFGGIAAWTRRLG